MKLKKYQQGGGMIYTPFIPEDTASTGYSSSSKSSGNEDSKLDPLDKEILSLMKDQNLLPSDVNQIFARLIAFQKKSQSLSTLGDDSYRSVVPGMLQIMQMVSNARNNKASWDAKLSEIKNHDAGSEVAMDSYGRMWVQDENGIKKINPSEFDSEKYVPLSNSQLMSLRQQNSEFAFRDDLFGDTGLDVVGMADVRKEIDDIIDKFGTIKSVEFKKQVFKDIASDLQGEGIYKITSKYSKADLNDFSGLLLSQLSASARHLLNANAAISGYDPIMYIKDIIIPSRTDVEVDPQYEASLTKAVGAGGEGGSGSGDDEKNLVEDSYLEELARGNNFPMPRETIFNPTSKISVHAYVQNTGELKQNDGSTKVTPGMLDAVFEKVGLKDISPQTTVTFGDQLIDERDLDQLLFDGTPVQRVDLPYTQINGEVTVDWDLVETIEEANQQLASKSVTPGILKELASNNPKLVWNEDTQKLEARNHMWFITFGALIGDDYVSDDVDLSTRWLEKMSDDRKEEWKDKYVEAIQYGFVNHEKNAPKRTGHHNTKWGWPIKFNYNSNFYHGNVFIPVLNTLAGVKEYSSKNTRTHNMQTQAAADREVEIQQQVRAGERSFNW